MPKDDVIEYEGKVVEALPNANSFPRRLARAFYLLNYIEYNILRSVVAQYNFISRK